ncbi:Na(+)/H(+) antiporter subunit F1 [Saliterribacillus persicus]|uniref:Multisubunit sodium/proton antiporter MrpF subunit n=1 Tax=Saliterribacillus persicus TaxID=930114 RepID=A0A368XE31_9BACI|nr:Na(+)/H(+) antiporter subunit F1 [Saliterribacillus persicus]RCW65288.1 multisubunit sodium/proton antiporter MrpF subunit [Saliterribacillus persicus]
MNGLEIDFKDIIQIVTVICLATITVSIGLLLYRVIKGPTNPDRAVALDAIGINLMALAGLTAIMLVTTRLNDVVLLIGILLFIGTIALAKYLEKGVIIDRDMD